MQLPAFFIPFIIALYLIAINFFALAAFGIDKSLAEKGSRRIAEDTPLLCALIGGSPGAFAGRSLFRHKTRKQPFSNNLFGIVVLQVLAVGGLIGWFGLG